MRTAVTGTPGTGKTTATKLLDKKYKILHLNKLIKRKNLSKGYDKKRNSLIADVEEIENHLPKEAIIESHLSHLLDVDKAIVLRCHPDELEKRLKTEDKTEIRENQISEAIDQILIEAINQVNEVHEIDTTNKSKKRVAELIEEIIEEKTKKEPGKINWSTWLERNI